MADAPKVGELEKGEVCLESSLRGWTRDSKLQRSWACFLDHVRPDSVEQRRT